jgi:hypothetical protein
MIANISIDNDEELAAMCGKCKSRAETPRCTGCGSEFVDGNERNNPNFDEERFNQLKRVRA